jgi:hypothetical protein
MCWGFNGYGQLGIGSTVDQHSPSAVDLGSGKIRCISMYVLPVQSSVNTQFTGLAFISWNFSYMFRTLKRDSVLLTEP